MNTDTAIATLTTDILTAVETAAARRGDYLRALVADTQEELGARTRVRSGKVPRLTPEGIQTQVAALTKVHDRFYAVVVRVAAERGAKGVELNRQTNFARTSLYAVRTWIKAANDITALAAARVTKGMLAVVGRKVVRPPSPAVLKNRVERQSKSLVAAFLGLIDVDVAAATQELNLLLAQLTDQLGAITGKVTRNPAQAAAEGRPLKIKGQVFLPTHTQVITAAAQAGEA